MNTHTYLKTILLSLCITHNISSYCMENMPLLPQETQLKIFASTVPVTKNCWLKASSNWKKIGSKSKPNIYSLIRGYSPICANQKDITFMLFNAAFDGHADLVKQLLEDNPDQHNAFYKFPESYNWDNATISFRYFDVQDIIRDQQTRFNIAIIFHNAKNLAKKYTNNIAVSNVLLSHIDQNKRNSIKHELQGQPCATHDLMLVSYSGEASPIGENLCHPNTIVSTAVERVNYALCIAIHRNNKHIIPIICDFIKSNKENFRRNYQVMKFFDLAAILKQKDIFEMLITNNTKILNIIYPRYNLLNSHPDALKYDNHYNSKFTYLDLMKLHAASHPDLKLDEYIALIEKHGGKSAKELIKS